MKSQKCHKSEIDVINLSFRLSDLNVKSLETTYTDEMFTGPVVHEEQNSIDSSSSNHGWDQSLV